MDDVKSRLVTCFQTVFPEMTAQNAPQASQATLSEWDSVAAITLLNVVEDEFGIEIDMDALAELDSFEKVREYLQTRVQVA